MNEVKITGGARIGSARATWPFATLIVTNTRLDLNAAIIGNYSFTADQIVSIAPYRLSPFSQGIKINHTVQNYKEKVIFSSFDDPNKIIDDIRKTGFWEISQSASHIAARNAVNERQEQGGLPIKKPARIAIVAAWNILILFDIIHFVQGGAQGNPLGIGGKIALGLLIIVSILTLISADFRKLILKDGREIEEIRKFIYFSMFIAGFILLGLLLAKN